MTEPEELLRLLISSDERFLREVLAPTPELDQPVPPDETKSDAVSALDRRTRNLVRLAALLALDAPTASVRWAVELAWITGATDGACAAVLAASAAEVGEAQVGWGALSLALALDFDLEGGAPEPAPRSQGPPVRDRAAPPPLPALRLLNGTPRPACGRSRAPGS